MRRVWLSLVAISSAGVLGAAITGGLPKTVAEPAVRTVQRAHIDAGHVITAGQGAGRLSLGANLTQLATLVPPRWQRAMSSHGTLAGQLIQLSGCGHEVGELDWPTTRSPAQRANGGVTIYLLRGRVLQIAFKDPDYRTQSGITVASSPEAVRREFSPLEAYVLRHDNPPSVGGRDLIYWVNEKKGIAFAFAYNGPSAERSVFSVYVFTPGAQFLPAGCVEYPQKWQKLAPYTAEIPNR